MTQLKYTPDKLAKKIKQYFNMKEKKRKDENKTLMYTSIFDVCSFLEITTRTWRNYRQRPEHFPVIKKAEERIYANWVEQLFYPGRNSTGAMFYLKNNAGWADKIEHQHKGKIEHKHTAALEELPAEQLEQLNSALEALDKENNTIDVTPEKEQIEGKAQNDRD
jgi:hypothetical protein